MTGRSGFATTRWSVILAARGPRSPAARAALAELCQTYWYPLYAYARRRGREPEDAEDSVQAFFASLLEREHLVPGADPERGRFRAYLLRAFKNALISEHKAASALKRGGGAQPLSLDAREEGERRLSQAVGHEETPERLFERDFALCLLDAALARVRESYAARGRADAFDALADVLAPGTDPVSHEERAAQTGQTPGAVKVAIHRLRRRYREALVATVADTLDAADLGDDPEQSVQLELQRLLATL